MINCKDCLFFRNQNRDSTGLCGVHEQITLPPYIPKDVVHINIVNTTDSCGLARAKLKPEFIL
jgi:hypothetical protein